MERRFNSGMALHHRRYRNFCLHFPQQKDRAKIAATKPNQRVTCKEETREAPVAGVQTNTERHWEGASSPNPEQDPNRGKEASHSLEERCGQGRSNRKEEQIRSLKSPIHRRKRNLKTFYMHALDRRARD
ncbi:unnamed protein product [Brassica oleracea]